jgi:signal transduction histidine kinase
MKLIYKILLSHAFIIVVLLMSLAMLNLPKIDGMVFNLEQKNAEKTLDKVYGMTKCVADRIANYRRKVIEDKKESLKYINQIVNGILQFHYDEFKKGMMSEAEAKKEAFEEIDSLRYGENGYIFIFDDTYHIVAHANKAWIGTYMYDKKDTKGNYYARNMIDITRKNGESFTQYWWAKIEGKEYEKLSYTKLFKPWKLYFGTGVYIDDIEKDVIEQKKLLKKKLKYIMQNNPIGKTGYVYIFDKNGNMLIHPDENMLGANFRAYKNNNTGDYLYKDLIEAAKTDTPLEYKWNKVSDKSHFIYDKISWVRYEPRLQWYVASSAYLDDFKNTSKHLIHDILFYGIFFVVLSLILSLLYTRKMLKPLDVLMQGIQEIQQGNYKTRVELSTKDEIGALAKSFNTMAETVEDNIENLDLKIKEKTQKISAINANLEIEIEKAILKTKKSEKLLQEQSRLAQMGEMINMIAHQWRQPLGAISSSVIAIDSKLKLGKFDLSLSEDREKFLLFLEKKHKNINEYVKTLSETIDDFRSFFKPDKKKERVHLCDSLYKALNIVEASMESRGIEVEYKCDEKIYIYLYTNEIMQVILNLLKNAEDNFIEQEIASPKITMRTITNSTSYIVEVCDNGGGIAEDILPNIFDPYFSTKLEKNGTGLGLYMSKVMVEEHHNGKMEVENYDGGVCFRLIFYKESVD